MKKIVLAGGCFWGVEAYFKQLKGVDSTSVGYVDGNFENPTYEQVCSNIATHTEACEITYNSETISLEKILEHYFRIVNPFSLNRQGNDVGYQYRSGIYYESRKDETKINNYLKTYFGKDYENVVVVVKQNTDYQLAEINHQNYLAKNPHGYCHIDLGLAKKKEVK